MVRLGTIKMLQSSRQYTCKNGKCGHTFRVYADFEQGHVLQPPKACPKVRPCSALFLSIRTNGGRELTG